MIDPMTLLVSLLLAAQPQAEETSATETTGDETELAQKQEEANDDDKIICKRTAVIGSKFKKKICGTKKQWETLQNRGTEQTRDMQRRGKGLEPVG